jgi:hypothetical protein
MNISSVSGQAIALKEQFSQQQIGIEAMRQQAESQKKLAEMLDRQAKTVAAPLNPQEGGFSTYA